MPVKFYWFYLESFVYVAIKKTDLLLYNTLTGKILSYIDKPRLIEFLLNLNRKENLYALKVSREFLKENDLEDFINDISGHFMGDLIDVSLAQKKPFIMPPHFDIWEGVEEQPPRTLKNVSKDSLFTIKELTFFVNSICDNNCPACNTAGKQFLWCTREKEDSKLELTKIKTILDQTKACPIKTINIIGGNLTQYPYLNQLKDLLSSGSFNVNYYFHLSHLKDDSLDTIRAGNSQSKATLLVDCSTLTFPGDLTYLKQLEPDRWIFLIQRDEEIPILERIIDHLKTGDISVQPYFNGFNLDFFKANVFTDYESLIESILDIGVINARKSHNPLNYGKLFIRSNGSIYSDLNGMPLGEISEMSMGEAVITELSEHGNWLRVRRDVAPCGDCLLNSICPPLSNFENAIGINNSCNIWKNHETIK